MKAFSTTVLASLIATSTAALADNTQTIEELRAAIAQQQAQLDALTAAMESQDSSSGLGNLSLGGYGEVHYNNLSGDAGNNKDELDVHRFVLFLGHEFSDTVRLFTELEVEHALAGEGKNGEVEVEQAFIEWDYAPNHSASAGVFLMPVGLLNETHEPDTFYGVERNNVEKNIIPTTWWEGGLMESGRLGGGLSYSVAVSSGLNIDAEAGKYKIRDGRQKASEADASNFAYTAAINYVPAPGVSLGGALVYQTDVLQGSSAVVGTETLSDIDAVLVEVHADLQNGPYGLRALVANWSLDDQINTVKDGADRQFGWYIEPSYKATDKLGVFARYSEWDNQAGADLATATSQVDLGLNYWLADTVVLKADYQFQDADAGNGQDGFNLGVGWSF